MTKQDKLYSLLQTEMESHIKGQLQRDNRLIQLRLLSFLVLTGLMGFVQIDGNAQWYVMLFLAVTLGGLFVFDVFYSKINRQQANRVTLLASLSENGIPANFEFYPHELAKIIPGHRIKSWCSVVGFDHLWYLFIFIVSAAIFLIKCNYSISPPQP